MIITGFKKFYGEGFDKVKNESFNWSYLVMYLQDDITIADDDKEGWGFGYCNKSYKIRNNSDIIRKIFRIPNCETDLHSYLEGLYGKSCTVCFSEFSTKEKPDIMYVLIDD